MPSGVATSGLQPRAFLGSHVARRTGDLVVGSAGGSCLHSPICDLIHLPHPLLGLQHASPSNCTLLEVLTHPLLPFYVDAVDEFLHIIWGVMISV